MALNTQVECSNGQVGFGRRRREVRSMPPDPNKVFEITISSFYKVNYKEESLLEKGRLCNNIYQLIIR